MSERYICLFLKKNAGGYAYIQRGVGTCGVSNIEEYGYYAVGGIAYVNGTGFYNQDNFSIKTKLTLLEKILTWKYLSLVLSLLIAITCLFLAYQAIMYCYRRVAYGRGVRRAVGGGGSRLVHHGPPTVVIDGIENSRTALSPGRGGAVTRNAGGRRTPNAQRPGTDWACNFCTFLNPPNVGFCQMCTNQAFDNVINVGRESTPSGGRSLV